MVFDWDKKKNQSNKEKHGIDFNDVKIIFKNPILAKEDNRINYGEKRWIAIGLLDDIVIVIVYTLREDSIRIISARKANQKEKTIYYERFK